MSEEGQPERDPLVWVETVAGQEIHRFKAVYETQYSAVYAFVLRRLFGSHEDAADVTAEVFATAWRRVAHIPLPPEDRLWLFGVARRTLSRHQRGRKRRALLLRRLQTEAELWKRSELDSTNAQSDRERVRAAIARLRPADRDVLGLVLWEQLSHSEVAQVLGCSINAVGLRLHKARSRLRQDLLANHDRTTEDARIEEPIPSKEQRDNAH